MNKQQIQNIVLTVLICSSLIFTTQIWFNEKLWPEGYNFFVNAEKYYDTSGENNALYGSELVDGALSPTSLAVYTVKDFDHAAIGVDASNENYDKLNSYVKSAIKAALETDVKSYVKVSEADWRNALFTNGIYVDYGINYPTATFAALMGVNGFSAPEMLGSVKRFAVTEADSLSDNINIYMTDGANGYYKVLTKGGKSEFSEVTELFSKDVSVANRFSFFLSADTTVVDTDEAVFDPYLILSEDSSTADVVSASNPISEDGQIKLSSSVIDKLLNKFDINSTTARKYTDADSNLVYVQNDATLKISTDGVIEYKVVSDRQGMPLAKNAAGNMSSNRIIHRCIEFIGEVNGIMNNPVSGLYIRDLNDSGDNIRLGMGYRAGGKSVVFEGSYAGMNAVSIETNGQYLISYTQIVRNYTGGEKSVTLGSTYAAADNIFANINKEEKQVENMFIAYADDGSEGEKQPAWFIKLKSSENYYR